ncbi:MAG: metallophosphatase family protein [Bacteroidales bacterium]|nr:metallophosphatase family protein [Saprospiraceae bacterium]MCF8381575.1 metallophosphatase family protein [Bacteroidales bacterium]
MNRIAFISDIHGNLPALDAVLEDIAKRGISKIYCLGDLVGYYCFFNEVVERISQLNIPTIMGNHDYAFVNNKGIINYSKTCTRILKWQLEHSNIDTQVFLKTLPVSLDFKFEGKSIFCVHAGLNNFLDEYVYDITEEYLKAQNFDKDVLITGHTHLISYKTLFSGQTWVNTGSVGQPRDLDNRASYLIIDESFNVDFVRISYDYMKVVDAMKKNGFEDYISDTLITGKKIGYQDKLLSKNK